MHTSAQPVLLAYDGSRDARHAVAAAGRLFTGRAVVVHVYASPIPVAAALPGPGIELALDPAVTADVERQARTRAGAVLQQGVELARAAGFDPEPDLAVGHGAHAVWDTIVEAANRHDARVIVVGHQHLSWIKERLHGRVDSGVVRHAGRPVLVVPEPTE